MPSALPSGHRRNASPTDWFSFETWRLIEEEAYGEAVASVVVSVAVAMAEVVLGYAVSAALIG